MEVNMSSLAARETALNRAATGHDILSKTLQKTQEAKQQQSSEQPVVPSTPKNAVPGRIDVYA